MPFQLSRRIFLGSAVLCILLRVYLHLTCIDPTTGFYSGGQAVMIFYYALLTATILALMVLGRRTEFQAPRIVVTPVLRGAALVCSLGVAILAVPNAAQLQGPAYLPHSTMLVLLRTFTLSLAPLITAVLLIYIAVKSREEFARVNGYLMLLPVIWMVTMLLIRFMNYTASRHVSDQMLTIVLLAFSTLFLLPVSRLSAGLSTPKAARQLIIFGLPFALLACSVCAGILAGPQADIPLALTIPESIAFLAMGLFAMVMVFSLKESEE